VLIKNRGKGRTSLLLPPPPDVAEKERTGLESKVLCSVVTKTCVMSNAAFLLLDCGMFTFALYCFAVQLFGIDWEWG